jgi:uncharacterized protein (TIGR03437 family)
MRVTTIRLFALMFLCAIAGAQTFDSSGNGLLKGTYYFREVFWVVGDSAGDLSQATALYGTISFDGNGNYSVSGAQVYDSGNGLGNFSITGTYTISASGYGTLGSLVTSGGLVYGLVSQGIFIGSSTETGLNDLFIAAPLASPAPTNSFFHGAYTMVDMDLSSGTPTGTFDSTFQLNPDGNGNIGTVSITGYLCPNGCGTLTQNNSGVKYFFSNGGANVNFAGNANSSLIFGEKYLYFSPDGNFVFGGDPQAWDMMIGVRSGTTAPSFGGLYYHAGVYQNESLLSAGGSADLNTYFGSFSANNGNILADQRLLSVFNTGPYHYTYSDTYSLSSNGTYNDGNFGYVFGNGGALRIGVGTGSVLGINVAVQAPSLSGPGVYINPTGVVNSASFAPFTSGVAPGEFITIFGTNLAPSAQSNSAFPTQINGVQVLINGNPVPIYTVTPTQISALVPFVTGSAVAAIQVVNNGATSNTVTEFLNLTAPGVFTQQSSGTGYAAALHADSSLVTPNSPAQPGEVVAMFVSGLGTVNPAVADGTPGPTSTLSVATNSITVLVGSAPATVAFAGLAPQLVGLYQINFTVPSGLTAGDNFVDIIGPDYYTSQALISVGTGTSAAASSRPIRGIPVTAWSSGRSCEGTSCGYPAKIQAEGLQTPKRSSW